MLWRLSSSKQPKSVADSQATQSVIDNGNLSLETNLNDVSFPASFSPKQILEEEAKKFDLKFSTSKDVNDSGLERYAGIQGWLQRETNKDHFMTVWVALYENRLYYSNAFDPNSDSPLTTPPRRCTGFYTLNTETVEVKIKYAATSPHSASLTASSSANHSNKLFLFQVKDGDSFITFGVDNEALREEWVNKIKQAITGVSHYLGNIVLLCPFKNDVQVRLNRSSSDSGNSPYFTSRKSLVKTSLDVASARAVEYPYKTGYLKKISADSSYGLKVSINKRWFRLDSGELRYYEDEDMKPTKCKGVFDLHGAALVNHGKLSKPETVSDTTGHTISINLNSGRTLKLEALTHTIAVEWINSIQETLALLNNNFGSYNDSNYNYLLSAVNSRKERRLNIYDNSLTNEIIQNENLKFQPCSPSVDNQNEEIDLLSPKVHGGRRLKRGVDPTKSPEVLKQSSLHHDPITDILMQHFLLKTVADLSGLIETLHEQFYLPGDVVAWEGVLSNCLCIVESGQCEVLKDGQRISLLFPGQTFGHLSLISDVDRNITVRALQYCRILTLKRHELRLALYREEYKRKTERMYFLRQISLFEKLLDSNLEKLVDVMVLKTYKIHDKIIRQGDVGDCFYMIYSGRVSITQTSTNGFTGSISEIAKIGPGCYFGELALIEDAPRKASVTAIEKEVQCYVIDRTNFLTLFGSMNMLVNESIGIKVLKNVKLLETLSEKQLITISRSLTSKDYAADDVILQQGDIGDSFFLIASGEVSVTVNHIVVATLQSGSFFGEMSLLSNEKRSATVAAITETKCLVLSRADFNNLLGPLDELIKAESKRRSDMINSKRNSANNGGLLISKFANMFSSPKRDSTTLGVNKSNNALFANTNNLFDLDHLDKVKVLAKGTFSTVYLVRDIMSSTRKLYAMKVIHKERLRLKGMEETVFRERDLLLTVIDSPFSVALYATLQDSKSLCMIQQYIPGGDMWTYLYVTSLGSNSPLRSRGTMASSKSLNHSMNSNISMSPVNRGLSIASAQYYFANVLTALNHIHDQEIIHRDLKPENILIDAQGYIKLCDFGCAKKLFTGSYTYTLCGTPEYISPEILLCKGSNRAVDFWQLGILLYELLTRTTPFYHENISMIFTNILDVEESLKVALLSSNLDNFARNLITGLLSANPNLRPGMLHSGLDDIWNHSFMKGITAEQILRKDASIIPPYIPYLLDDESNDDNTQNDVARSHSYELDMLEMVVEDEDDVPEYKGNFDYSNF
eukprot:gene13978-18747_t